MSSYAILGATGQIGGNILTVLLAKQPPVEIHCFVRTKAKLLKAHPDLASASNVTIYEAGLDDTAALAQCIKDTRAVFLTAAASENVPGCEVAQQQTRAIIAALKTLLPSSQSNEKAPALPKLVIISSASVTPRLFGSSAPWIMQRMVHLAFYHIYTDLEKAEAVMRAESHWIPQVYVKPGGLTHDAAHGHVLASELKPGFLSFVDLAGAMVEVAGDDGGDGVEGKWRWDGVDVTVNPAREGTRVEPWLPYIVPKGLLWTFAPWLYPYLGSWLP